MTSTGFFMRYFIRNGLLAITLFSAASFVNADTAQARTSFSISVGVPLGYHGGGWSGYYGHGHRRSGYVFSGWYSAPYYRPYYRPNYYYRPGYTGPRFYDPAPVYYPRRPVYRSYGPIFSLGLFPTYVGDTMSRQDRDLYYTAYRRALAAPVGEGFAWTSDRANGEIITTRDGWAGERYCREFRQNVNIDGRSQEAYGTACQMPNGDWQFVQNQ